MTVFKEENKDKRIRPNREIIIYSLLRDEKIINVTSSRRYFFFIRAKFDANNELFKENLVK